jgi:hypothetical protein
MASADDDLGTAQQTAFEAALDVLTKLIVKAQRALTAEMYGNPGDGEVQRWLTEVDRLVALRDNLEPDDREAVAGVLEAESLALRLHPE